MSNTVKNVLAVIVGVVVGMAVNGGLISISSAIIPPPEGVDTSNMESLKKGMLLFQPKHFLFPFLAHALGTFVGAALAAAIAASFKKRIALALGVFFLAGGIAASQMLPAPRWFSALDLLLAYIPMAWCAWLLVKQFSTDDGT